MSVRCSPNAAGCRRERRQASMPIISEQLRASMCFRSQFNLIRELHTLHMQYIYSMHGGAVCVRMCAYHAKMRFGIAPPTRVLSIFLSLELGRLCKYALMCSASRVFIIIAYSVIYDHRQRALSAYLLCGGGAMGENGTRRMQKRLILWRSLKTG